ncbi:Heat stress transcription factor A-4b [Platanthera zijinensis]|uniref:Heat stress transcription factor A-4b n=1 Tax=Platanthera zijinensis TaxID=2320716 RepID=A0AAP0BHW9_9ASPA
MESSHGGSSSPAPFLIKTYDMLDEPSTNSIVSWSQSGCSFVVWNPLDFARDLLPVYFKHNNFSSFIRQLNTYVGCHRTVWPKKEGFRKIDPERWEFANDEFIRGQKHLLKNIHRRKPIHSHSIPQPGSNLLSQLSYPERQELMDEIERLKLEKSTLIIELEKHAQHQLAMDQHMQDLEDRLHGMALRQRNLISFLDQAIQRPGFLSSLIQHSDLQAKKRRLPTDDDCPLRDAAMQERFVAASIPALDIEPFEKMESSLNSLEVFFQEVGVASGEDAFSEDRLPCLTTDMHAASSCETDFDVHSPICHSSCPENVRSRPESAPGPVMDDCPIQAEKMESSLNSLEAFFHEGTVSGEDAFSEDRLPCLTTYMHASSSHESDFVVQSPIRHSTCPENNRSCPESTAVPVIDDRPIQAGVRSKALDIDMNSEPDVNCLDQRKENLASTRTIGVNDTFWEQFLTESPGYWDAREIESERNEADGRRAVVWNRKNVDHLTERMCHLTSTERT